MRSSAALADAVDTLGDFTATRRLVLIALLAVGIGLVGALLAKGLLLLIALSPAIQVQVLGRPRAMFPLGNPGLVTIPLAFVTGIVVSLLAPEPGAHDAFPALQKRLHLGAD